MAPTLYMVPGSPPVRSVLITARALGIQLEQRLVDLTNQEHKTPWYLKLNPQHTVPTLVDDDGFTIWDSHAINVYLVSKYGKDDTLYPKDPKKRAIVDQRLHFDSGVAFGNAIKIIIEIIAAGKSSLTDGEKQALKDTYAFLEAFLQDIKWIAGEAVTLADYHLYTTITATDILVPVDGAVYPKLTAWLKRVDDLPEAEASKKGLCMFREMMLQKLK